MNWTQTMDLRSDEINNVFTTGFYLMFMHRPLKSGKNNPALSVTTKDYKQLKSLAVRQWLSHYFMYSIISYGGTHRGSLKGYTSNWECSVTRQSRINLICHSLLQEYYLKLNILPRQCPSESGNSKAMQEDPSCSSPAGLGQCHWQFPHILYPAPAPRLWLNCFPSLKYTSFYTTNMSI